MARTTRLDILLVERGIVESREKAKRLLMAGSVLVNDLVVDKADHKTFAEDKVTLKQPEKFVSRGGYKLEAALDAFDLSVEGLVCVDLGASTGGFTDCLLQRGAQKVYAIDVGFGQLCWKLQNDPRVESREKVNARSLLPGQFAQQLGFACIDVSFISLRKILPVAFGLLQKGTSGVALIKPQFEAGKQIMDKCKGVLKDHTLQEQIAQDMEQFARDIGFDSLGYIDSPLFGADGNREFLIGLDRP